MYKKKLTEIFKRCLPLLIGIMGSFTGVQANPTDGGTAYPETTVIANKVSATIPLKKEKNISGTITGSDGAPLIGANVQVKAASTGTTTDLDGNYQLSVPDEATILVVSYIGFAEQEISINGRSVIDVVLSESASQLDEVVVVGYGTRKKSDLTGAVVSVSNKDFNKQPLTRIDQALQGRTAGVQVNQTSGAPGAGYKIRIRGANSIGLCMK